MPFLSNIARAIGNSAYSYFTTYERLFDSVFLSPSGIAAFKTAIIRTEKPIPGATGYFRDERDH